MKKLIYIFLALFLVSCGSKMTASFSTDNDKEVSSLNSGVISSPEITLQSILSNMDKGKYKEGEILVKFKSGVSKTASLTTHQTTGASIKKSFTIVPNLEHVQLPQDLSVRDAIIQYMSDPNVEYAEPNYLLSPATVTPNDTYFGNQYALHNTGTYASGTDDADIDAPEAWGVTTGSNNIIIAVLDTGIDYNHSDLVGNLWTNPLENPSNGVDDDGNGKIDDWRGWNFLFIDKNENGICDRFPEDPVNDENCHDPFDDIGHGTHVAGIIGAEGNNGEGVAGVMWDVQLMALKACCTADGFFTTDAIIGGIEYAVSKGAKIINGSFGGTMYAQTIFDAINSANNAKVLFVASAGNGDGDGDDVGDNNDLMPMYPASYNLPNIISVAATDQNDERVSFSNYGPTSVDVAAPGVYIFSTVPNWWSEFSGYGVLEFLDGTSMSAPYVSGLAGLLYSYYDGSQNTEFDYTQVRDTIFKCVDRLPSLKGWIRTGGRINAHKAVSSLLTPSALSASAASSTEISLSWTDNANCEDGYRIERDSGAGFVEIDTTGPNSTAYTDSGLDSSTTYTYRIRAYNNIAASVYSNTASATPSSEETTKKSGNGGGCSVIAGQSNPPVDIAILLIPLISIFIAAVKWKRQRKG